MSTEGLEKNLNSPGIGRRPFLVGALSGVVSLFGISTFRLSQSATTKSNNYGRFYEELWGDSYLDSIQEDVDRIKTIYGVDISFEETVADRYDRKSQSANTYEKKRILDILSVEFEKYPEDFFINNELETVRIFSYAESPALKAKGVDIAGFALPWERSIVILSGGARVDFKPNIIRQNFHHEVFHHIDYVLNEGGFTRKEWNLALTNKLREVIASEQSALHEYRANLAAQLMMPNAHLEILRTISEIEDKEIQKNLAWQYFTIMEYYRDASRGQMNDKYWIDLTSGRLKRN